METYSAEIVVEQPRHVVFERLRHFEHYPRFMDSIDAVERLGDDRLRWTAKVGPMTRDYESTIVAQEPNRLAWRTDEQDVQEAGEIRLHADTPEKTRVRLDASYDLDSVAYRFADAIGYLEKKVDDDITNLKHYLEGAPAADASPE